MKFMQFPLEEYESIQARFDSGLDVFTTRVDEEFGKWELGEVVNSPFGCLEIDAILAFHGVANHPFISELTPDQVQSLSKYEKFDLLKLSKAGFCEKIAAKLLGLF
jgi:hypothetical protein